MIAAMLYRLPPGLPEAIAAGLAALVAGAIR